MNYQEGGKMSESTIIKLFSLYMGTVIYYFFGFWNELLSVFVIALIIDYISGIIASLKNKKKLNSNYGFWGITKKGLMFLVIIFAHRLDVLFNSDILMNATIFFYLTNELISILENYSNIGLPLPKQITDLINTFSDREKDIFKKNKLK